MRSYFVMLVAAGLIFPAMALAAAPAGWFLAGSDPASYQASRDLSVKHDGKSSASLASVRTSKGFGTLMQTFAATDYLGKRLKLSAWVKASGVKSWAGVWMRVDGANQKSTAFDNMQSRPIKGTRDWTRYEVVLDVAGDSADIAFGILLDGEGAVWMSDVQFQTVDNSVPTTGTTQTNRKPENLDFSR
jgi:hypothetical protein